MILSIHRPMLIALNKRRKAFGISPPCSHDRVRKRGLLKQDHRGILFQEVIGMAKKKKAKQQENLRLNPEERLAAEFDSVSIAKYPVADAEKVGFRVLDNCAEEHSM